MIKENNGIGVEKINTSKSLWTSSAGSGFFSEILH
jgi:hypothetical protein